MLEKWIFDYFFDAGFQMLATGNLMLSVLLGECI
jgi:hypothetical protein